MRVDGARPGQQQPLARRVERPLPSGRGSAPRTSWRRARGRPAARRTASTPRGRPPLDCLLPSADGQLIRRGGPIHPFAVRSPVGRRPKCVESRQRRISSGLQVRVGGRECSSGFRSSWSSSSQELKREEGQGATEYAMVIGFIIVTLSLGLGRAGYRDRDFLRDVADAMPPDLGHRRSRRPGERYASRSAQRRTGPRTSHPGRPRSPHSRELREPSFEGSQSSRVRRRLRSEQARRRSSSPWSCRCSVCSSSRSSTSGRS